MLIKCQHHYSERKIWHLCGLRPQSLLIDCTLVLCTEPAGQHCESHSIPSYVELLFQAPSINHSLLTKVYTLTHIAFLPQLQLSERPRNCSWVYFPMSDKQSCENTLARYKTACSTLMFMVKN